MLRMIKIAAALAVVATPALVSAEPTETTSFSHKGEDYVYTVETRGDVRVLKGSNLTDGSDFILYVKGKRVTGTVDRRAVSFSLASVKKLDLKTKVASR
jgi:hypothetical protein